MSVIRFLKLADFQYLNLDALGIIYGGFVEMIALNFLILFIGYKLRSVFEAVSIGFFTEVDDIIAFRDDFAA